MVPKEALEQKGTPPTAALGSKDGPRRVTTESTLEVWRSCGLEALTDWLGLASTGLTNRVETRSAHKTGKSLVFALIGRTIFTE